MVEIKRINTAFDLPENWDLLAENYFQKRKFLQHAETYNFCNQRYYLLKNDDIILASAIVYTLRLDIFTFLRIKSPLKMHIVGIPCSVSSQGIFGEKNKVKQLKEYILQSEKGFLLFLNLNEFPAENYIAKGKTLPTIVLKNQFDDWEHYVSSLRHAYRRRIKQLTEQNETLCFQKMKSNEFTELMYKQYLEVFYHSNDKLEKLTYVFFKNLPEEFILTVCLKNNVVLGWNLAVEDEKMYYFFLGGIDYEQNKQNSTYLRLLTQLVQDGIAQKTTYIELGQTAEIAKMRMGGKPEELYMQATHSNKMINFLLKKFAPLLDYKPKFEKTNAIK